MEKTETRHMAIIILKSSTPTHSPVPALKKNLPAYFYWQTMKTVECMNILGSNLIKSYQLYQYHLLLVRSYWTCMNILDTMQYCIIVKCCFPTDQEVNHCNITGNCVVCILLIDSNKTRGYYFFTVQTFGELVKIYWTCPPKYYYSLFKNISVNGQSWSWSNQ